MTLGAARITPAATGWRIDRQPGPDLAALLAGRPVAEVAALMPRLFNLCRVAQTAAARLALGLPSDADTGVEVMRDHLARLFVTLRRAFDLPALRPDARALFGPLDRLPHDLSELSDWMASETPAAELARAIDRIFPDRMGATSDLPPAPDAAPGAYENSPAGRQQGHPLLQAVAGDRGRGPLWRYLGVLADVCAARDGLLPAPLRLADGTAVVQAARGAYALRLGQAAGRVTAVARLTPTDHQLAPGGALDQALATLPANRPDLAQRLVALHDPCIPVTVEGARDA